MRRYANKPKTEWLMTTDSVTAAQWPLGWRGCAPSSLSAPKTKGRARLSRTAASERRVKAWKEEDLQLQREQKDAFNTQEAIFISRRRPFQSAYLQQKPTPPDCRLITENGPPGTG
uniref:Uncharacterized protein n=1 Tax=Nothobranchius kadleci TaxID=1051664 RepID=A0A1A8CQ53_NOTKA